METNGHINGIVYENGVNEIEVEVSKASTIASDPTVKKIEIPMAKLAEIEVSDFMKSCIDRVALAEGFKNFDAHVDHGSGIGDGFVGIMLKATIREKGSDRKLPIVIKTPPTNLARRNQFGSMNLFKREIYIYNEFLPELVKFQEEKNIKPSAGFFEFPKCYLAEYNEELDDAILIMEDLRENSYKMWDKFVPVNFEHAKLVFTALGKLHAVSFALKIQKPVLFESFQKLNDVMGDMMDDNFETMMKLSIERAIDTLDETDTKKRARVAKLNENFTQMMKNLCDSKFAEPFAVITHGDCWSNNYMFQYRRGFPEKTVLLDWQLSRYCSPVLDLVYFCFAGTEASLRAKHYDELINIYHRSLKDLLDHMGGDSQTQFPFTALLRQLKQFGKFGIVMASMIVPMLSMRPENIPDMDFMAENMNSEDPEMIAEMMKSFGPQEDGYKPRMRGNLLDALRFGYL